MSQAPSITPDSATAEIVIESGHTDAHYWRDLWRYHELLWFLAWRDVKVRYKQAVLGAGWAVLQPAMTTILLTFVFGKLAKMPPGNAPYPMLVLAGLLPWQLFSNAFNGAGSSLISNSQLISKVYFPRMIAPLSSLAVALLDMAIVLVLSGPVALAFGVVPTWRLLLLPIFIVGCLVVALGSGLWITALTVKYRDFRFIAPFLLQIGLFVTPVGYRIDNIPSWRGLLALNPLTGVVDGFRWCLLAGDTALAPVELIASAGIGALLLWSGIWYFRKTERRFADVI
jgi:lipopolysaccharide transport system permease protein